jgi:hypothetical protein
MKPRESDSKASQFSTMKILAFALLTALVAAIVAKHVHVPFINSTGLTVNDVPYETRLYWMKQAEEVLYKYSGPW